MNRNKQRQASQVRALKHFASSPDIDKHARFQQIKVRQSFPEKYPPRRRSVSNELVGNKLLNCNSVFTIRSSVETIVNMGDEL